MRNDALLGALAGYSTVNRQGLAGSEGAEAQTDTFRLKLPAAARIPSCCVRVRYSCAYPWENIFAAAYTAQRC